MEVAEQACSALTSLTAARVYLCLTTRFVFLRRREEAIRASERAVAFARQAGDLRIESLAQTFRGQAQQQLGMLDAAVVSLTRAEECARACGDLEALYETMCVLAMLNERRGAFDAAYATYHEVLAVATRLGDVGFAGWAFCALAACAFLAGEWDESRRLLKHSETIRHEWKMPGQAPAAGQALLALAHGAVDSPSLGMFAALAETAGEVEDHLWMYGVTLFAEQSILTGRAADALDWLCRARLLATDEVRSSGVLCAPLAWAETEMDHVETARQLLAEGGASRGPYSYIAELDLGRIGSLLALREGRCAEARAIADRCLDRCRTYAFPYLEAKALFVSGQVCEAEGDAEQARVAYGAALAICDRLGEGIYRPYIEQALRSLTRD